MKLKGVTTKKLNIYVSEKCSIMWYNEYKDKNFTIVGISLDKDKSKWMKAIADDNLAWTHLSDLKYWDSEIPALYGVRGIPANVLLDPDGVIVAKNITGEDLHKKLKEVIK